MAKKAVLSVLKDPLMIFFAVCFYAFCHKICLVDAVVLENDAFSALVSNLTSSQFDLSTMKKTHSSKKYSSTFNSAQSNIESPSILKTNTILNSKIIIAESSVTKSSYNSCLTTVSTPVLQSSMHMQFSTLPTSTVSVVFSSIELATVSATNSTFWYSSILKPSCTVTTMVICNTVSHIASSMFINLTSLAHSTTKLSSIPLVLSSVSHMKSSLHNSQIASTSIKVENISSAVSVYYSSAFIINPPIQHCEEVISTFSEGVSNFTHCVLRNMHPMTVCQKCVKHYDFIKNLHRKLFKDCGSTLIDNYNENYQVVPKILDAQTKTWTDLGCEKCIDGSSNSNELTNAFLEFLELYKDTKECFENNTYLELEVGNRTQPSNTTDSKQVCFKCESYYNKIQLNFKYYADNEEESVTPWCADINVAVNQTRHMWSSQFRCEKTQKDLESIIALTCFFCFLPIVFYVGTKLHSEVKERKTNRYYESE